MLLEVDNIKKSFADRPVLHSVSFAVQQHRTLSILGKSGCGKSTLLKIIAGLESADAGSIKLKGFDLSRVDAHRRNIVYLFQEPLLFPHLSVYDNVAFGLRVRKQASATIKKSVEQTIVHLGLETHSSKLPHLLSGGQKQRVAFGRALILNPPLLLLDEPFSSLDVETRASMQSLYKKIAAEYNITALFVTHDLKEALTMGDEVGYMENGVLDVYASKTEFVQDDRTGVRSEKIFWDDLK